MSANKPEAKEPWLVTPQDGVKMLNWFRDELNKVRKCLVEAEDEIQRYRTERDALALENAKFVKDNILIESAVTVNILRSWPQWQIRRFADHLLGKSECLLEKNAGGADERSQ